MDEASNDPMKLMALLWPDVYFYEQQRQIIYSAWDNDQTSKVDEASSKVDEASNKLEVPPQEICSLGDPFGRICVKLLDPGFLKVIATKDPTNVRYRQALSAVYRLGLLADYDCIYDKEIPSKEIQ